jgi:hypothetical protein
MGLFKAIRAVKGLAATGSADGTTPKGLVAGLESLATTMAGLGAPMWLVTAPERGRPLPGTEPAAALVGDSQSLATGVAGIVARDSAFDPGLLTTFAEQVFAAVAAVWASSDAGAVRSVLADSLWEPLAAALTPNQSMAQHGAGNGILALAALQQGKATLANACAGTFYDSAVFAFQVQLGPGAPEMAREPWNEEWLLQRSVQPGGDPMALPENCPNCGAPASVDPTGSCSRCRAPIPPLTAGWLVSRIECHNPFLQAQYDQVVGELRHNPAGLRFVPPELRQLLPGDLQAMAAQQP